MAADKNNGHRFIMLYDTGDYDPIDYQLNTMIEKGDTIINCTGLSSSKVLVEYIPRKQAYWEED